MFPLRFLLASAFLIEVVFSRSPDIRQARAFRDPYTTTIIYHEIVKKVVPSSCVFVNPTLPPCRTLRYFGFPSFWGKNNTETKTKTNQTRIEDSPLRSEPKVQETSLSWGEYLGIYNPTVTVTKTEILTNTVEDKNAVVTYSVYGCRPVGLPPNIGRCSGSVINENIAPTQLVPNFQPTIAPTPSVPVAITAVPNFGRPIYMVGSASDQATPDIPPNNDISSSIAEHQNENPIQPTDILPVNI